MTCFETSGGDRKAWVSVIVVFFFVLLDSESSTIFLVSFVFFLFSVV